LRPEHLPDKLGVLDGGLGAPADDGFDEDLPELLFRRLDADLLALTFSIATSASGVFESLKHKLLI
jgi:hypothetical protein